MPSSRASVRASRGPSWVHEYPFLTIGWEETNGCGARSLKHCAMRQVVSDQSMLTPGLFTHIPWEIAKHIWDCLGSRKQTVYMWKLFATIYPSQIREIVPFRCMLVEGPLMPIREYLALLKTDSLRWGVALNLFTTFASVPELVEVASVKNLVALELNTPSERESLSNYQTGTTRTVLTDRIVRTWGELAESSDAFAHLRVLRISRQALVSRAVFQYLRSFPSLQLLVIYSCPNITPLFENGVQAIEGWQRMSFFDDRHYLHAPEELYGYYFYSFIGESGERGPSMDQQIPILGFQIGLDLNRPPSKMHTIYLERQSDQEQEAPEPAAKRPKYASQPRGRHNRGTMKERKTKDLNSVLKDLL